jgi:hypothetical protein
MRPRRTPSPRLVFILALTGAVATALAGSMIAGSIGARIWWIGTLLAVLGATVSAVVQHLDGRNALDGTVEPTRVTWPVTSSLGTSPRSAQRQIRLRGAVVTSAVTALMIATAVLVLWGSSDPPTGNNPVIPPAVIPPVTTPPAINSIHSLNTTSGITDTACATTPKLDAVMRYNDGPFSWAQVGGPASHIYGGGYGLIAAAPGNGDIYHYLTSSNTWEQIGGSGAEFALTADTIYALTPDRGAVMRYNGRPFSWTQVGGPADSAVPCR